MYSEQELSSLLVSLQNTLKLQSSLMAKFEQREAGMQATFDLRMQALQSETEQVHRRVGGIVSVASSQIYKEAKEALAPVAARYDSDVSATSAQLQRANRTVCMWFGAASSILLLTAFVAWTVLGYYRRELADTKEELQRYEDAVPVVQAFYASDAVICGGVICTNGDPGGPRAGDRGQYRAAKPRQRP